MASKSYFVRFGSGNPATYTGLAPTFIVFRTVVGTTTPPGFSELSTTGIYRFDYDIRGQIAFVIDGATTGLANADRYVSGVLDLTDQMDQVGSTLAAIGTTNVALGTTNVALGTTNVALGTTSVFLGTALGNTLGAIGTSLSVQGSTITGRIGTPSDVFGDDVTDPTTLYGFLKRCEQVLEGDSTYVKATGVLTMYDKTGATTLASKTIADTGSTVTKT